MEDPPSCIVQGLGRGEGLMTTFVRDDPETCAEEALEDGVEGPEGKAERV